MIALHIAIQLFDIFVLQLFSTAVSSNFASYLFVFGLRWIILSQIFRELNT